MRDSARRDLDRLREEIAMLSSGVHAEVARVRSEVEGLPSGRVWRGLLPVRRRIARLRGRIQ